MSPRENVKLEAGIPPDRAAAEAAEGSTVHLAFDPPFAWIMLARDRCLNAIDRRCVRDLKHAFLRVASHPDVRIAIVAGRGRAFCSGIDLKELATTEFDFSYFTEWEDTLRIVETMDKIAIAAVHGYCLGGGLQLALACDVRLSTPDCRLGLPAVKEALIPGLGPWRLARYVGMGRAKWLVTSGREITGREARRIGLVDELLGDEPVHQAARRAAARYLETCSVATRASKLLLNAAYDDTYAEALDRYLQAQERVHHSVDGDEARDAYLHGRTPRWH